MYILIITVVLCLNQFIFFPHEIKRDTYMSRTNDTGVYIEYTSKDGAVSREPTTLPIPSSTIDRMSVDGGDAVLVVTHEYLTKIEKGFNSLNSLNVAPIKRLKFIGGGGEVEPGLSRAMFEFDSGLGIDMLQSIEFCGVENVRHIPDNFLFKNTSLLAVDLSPFRNVTSIGHSFLACCPSLTSIDLRPLWNVTAIPGSFLSGCTAITTVDLSPLVNLESVDTGFLTGCTSLTSIDLSPFRKMTTVPAWFLNMCSSLESVDTSPLSNVTEVGSYFMAHCTALKSIDLAPLANVATPGHNFMLGCTSLSNIDLAPMASLQEIDKTFMKGCKAFKPAMRKKFMQSIEDRKNSVTVPTPTAARKVAVKAGGKKK